MQSCTSRKQFYFGAKEFSNDLTRSRTRVKIHPKAHLHWQKPKSKKPGFFVVPFTLPEKPIAFGVFGTKSACAKKPESHTCVLVSGAHARLLSTSDRTRVVRITLQAAVG